MYIIIYVTMHDVCIHVCMCMCMCMCMCIYMHVLLVFKIGENLVLYPTLFQIPYCNIFKCSENLSKSVS